MYESRRSKDEKDHLARLGALFDVDAFDDWPLCSKSTVRSQCSMNSGPCRMLLSSVTAPGRRVQTSVNSLKARTQAAGLISRGWASETKLRSGWSMPLHLAVFRTLATEVTGNRLASCERICTRSKTYSSSHARNTRAVAVIKMLAEHAPGGIAEHLENIE